MEKYLSHILKETNTIIIPGIGALTITDRSSGEIMFMSFLKHDDGALAKFISIQEGKEIEECKGVVAKFTGEIESAVSSGNSFEMKGFGSFRKDSSGDLVFEQYKEGVEVPVMEEVTKTGPAIDEIIVEAEKAPEIAVEVDSVNESVEEVSEVEQTVEEPEQPVEQELIIEETPMQETVVEPELRSEPIVEEPVIQLTPQAPITEENSYTEEQQWNDDLDLPPINATVERPKKPILEKAKPDKKRRSPMLYLLIVASVIVIGGATTVVLFGDQLGLFRSEEIQEAVIDEEVDEVLEEFYEFDDDSKEEEEDQEEEKEVLEEKSSKPVKVEKVEKVEPVKTEPKKPTPTVNPVTGGSYHVIAGSFGDPSNAERLVVKLKGLGLNASIIGQSAAGLHMVSAGSYATKEAAQAAILQNADALPKAYVLNKP